ncbi:MAG: 50S ribosomal protein L11 methyltransferase [Rikenellaceae bacterium]
MDYVELNVAVREQEMAEILMAELSIYPFESFDVDGGVLKCYIPQESLADCKAGVDDVLNQYGIEGARYISIETQNWNAEWESNFECVEVGTRLLIRAPFHDSNPAFEREVVIMPKMSFGTGHHATTHLIAEWTMDLGGEALLKDKSVLDMGSGTGVLSIVAAMEGAKSVDAIDIDEWADENCRENIAMNGVANVVHAKLGDASSIDGTYDFILANINRNILVRDMSQYFNAMNPGATILMSGFLEQDVEVLKEHCAKIGLQFVELRERDGWIAMRFQK